MSLFVLWIWTTGFESVRSRSLPWLPLSGWIIFNNLMYSRLFGFLSVLPRLKSTFLATRIRIKWTTCVTGQRLRYCRPPELENDFERQVAFSTSKSEENQWLPLVSLIITLSVWSQLSLQQICSEHRLSRGEHGARRCSLEVSTD